MWMVPRRCSFVGQPGPAFVRRPGPMFVWRRRCHACVRAEVGARRHRSCVLRWALIVAVRACWCGAHVAVHLLSAWACICSSSWAHVCLETRVSCVHAEVGACRHRLCVLRWALIIAVHGCWCGASFPIRQWWCGAHVAVCLLP